MSALRGKYVMALVNARDDARVALALCDAAREEKP